MVSACNFIGGVINMKKVLFITTIGLLISSSLLGKVLSTNEKRLFEIAKQRLKKDNKLYKEVVDLIKNKGVSVDIKDKAGNTPLHYALKAGKWEDLDLKIMKVIAENSKDINAKNEAKKTPLDKLINEGDYRNFEVKYKAVPNSFPRSLLGNFCQILYLLGKGAKLDFNKYFGNINDLSDLQYGKDSKKRSFIFMLFLLNKIFQKETDEKADLLLNLFLAEKSNDSVYYIKKFKKMKVYKKPKHKQSDYLKRVGEVMEQL